MYTHFAGLDEAALGPVLGPYCAAAVSFRIPDSTELSDLFSGYADLKIGDSKKIFTSGKTLAPLEKTALSFLYQLGKSIPENLHELLASLNVNEEHLMELKGIPWFSELEKYPVPAFCEEEEIESSGEELSRFMTAKSLSLQSVFMDVVPAVRFNRHLLSGKNKAETCQDLIAPLLLGSFGDNRRITVDRQGGRRYYGEWLMELFPGKALAIRRETPDLSEYDTGSSAIRFQVKGDDKFLETALASIFSKYIREMMMGIFNDYWAKKSRGSNEPRDILRTGKRFINDLDKAGVPYLKEMLIRLK